jgi:hypothetical protein
MVHPALLEERVTMLPGPGGVRDLARSRLSQVLRAITGANGEPTVSRVLADDITLGALLYPRRDKPPCSGTAV